MRDPHCKAHVASESSGAVRLVRSSRLEGRCENEWDAGWQPSLHVVPDVP